jgi:hypothetical protein
MNKTLRTLMMALGVIVIAGGLFVSGFWVSRVGVLVPWTMMSYSAPGNYDYGFGLGMMGRRDGGYRPEMMARGWGDYGPGGMMGGLRGSGGSSSATPLTIDQAKQAADKYIQSLNLQGLELGEVMVFDNNAYVVVRETVTGMGAFELLVDPISQAAFPEYGPNMMWNLKYGALNQGAIIGGRGGLMGMWNPQNATPSVASADMPVSQDQALKNAQAFLDQHYSGAFAASDPVAFYGYYTFDFTKDGKIAGMLSVNGYTGQVFPHTWHGRFIEEGK